jgi:hypothetical protein
MRSVSIAGLLLGALLAAACVDTEFRSEADAYLAAYEIEGQGLYYEWAEAEWASNTRIVEGDPTNAARTRDAREAMMRFAGSVENIDTIRAYLSQRGRLSDLQERQLEKMLSAAAEGPMTIPDVVLRRIAVETDQVRPVGAAGGVASLEGGGAGAEAGRARAARPAESDRPGAGIQRFLHLPGVRLRDDHR